VAAIVVNGATARLVRSRPVEQEQLRAPAPGHGSAGRAAFALVVAVGLVAVATWLVLSRQVVFGGVAAAAAGVALVAGAVFAHRVGRPVLRFLDSGVDRAFDGCLLSAIALTSRQTDGPAAGAALGALAASFLGAYVRARGVSLGYPVEESLVSRAIRYGLVALGLGTKALGPTMFALLAFTVLAAAVRGSQVAKKERE
jgi:hypothetical protein